MVISELTRESLLIPKLEGKSMEEILLEMVGKLAAEGMVKDPDLFLERLLEREKLCSTNLGNGVAFPHARSEAVSRLIFAVGKRHYSVPFPDEDNKARLFFMIAVPHFATGIYLQLLSGLAGFLHNKDMRQDLMAAKTSEEMFQVLREMDKQIGKV